MRTCSLIFGLLALLIPLGCSSTVSHGVAPGQFSDTTAYVQYLVDRNQVVPRGTYVLQRTIVVRKSNTIIQGEGPDTVFVFEPILPQLQCWNDRAFTTSCDSAFNPNTKTFVNRRRITAPIAIGDTSLQTTDDVSDLRPGDWIIITEKDLKIREVVISDWARVSSVSGNTIHLQTPFRTAFPNVRTWDPIYGGLGFLKVVHPVENVQFRNFTLEVPNSGQSAPGISIFAAQNIVVDHLNIDDSNGQALYSYLSKGVTFSNCSVSGSSEFAATVDLNVRGNTFSAEDGVGFGLDVGTGFFKATGNFIPHSMNIGMYLLYGVHDGIVKGNYIAFVPSSNNSTGILGLGMQNVAMTENDLAGGAGQQSIGISVTPTQNLEVQLPSLGNAVAPNTFGNWAMDYDPANQI